MPDLVCGYGGPDGGIVALHRGSVDAVYPNSREALRRKAEGVFTDTPFEPGAMVQSSPVVPNFMAAGDFDADGTSISS